MGILTRAQIDAIGFKYVGEGAKISDKCSFYGAQNIEIGANTRIDDFCILSAGVGGIIIGNHIHIAGYCSLIGKERIEMQDFSGFSAHGSIYSSSDDYSGKTMTNPTVPQEFTNVFHGPVIVEKHAIIGASCIVLPNVRIGYGAAVGAFSLVNRDVDRLTMVSGVPAKFMKARKDGFIEMEKLFLEKAGYI